MTQQPDDPFGYVPVSLESCKLGSLFLVERELIASTLRNGGNILDAYDDADTITLSVGDTFLVVETHIETKPCYTSCICIRICCLNKDGMLFWIWWSSDETPFKVTYPNPDNTVDTVAYATLISANTP